MKRFLKKLAFLLATVLLVYAALLGLALGVAAPQYGTEYTGCVVDKLQRLEALEGPKIILVGNSNLAFGMDSARLEAAMGMPVVNLGGHGSFGEEFQMNMAKGNIGPGDIVICAPTAYTLTEPDCELYWITLENHGLFSLVPRDCWGAMIKTAPRYALKTLLRWATGTGNDQKTNAYARSAFNEYGDNVYPRPESIGSFAGHSGGYLRISEEFVELFNEFNGYCLEQGAVCLLAASPKLRADKMPDEALLKGLQVTLEERLDCPVISDFPAYLMEESYFYDTIHHMTDAGVVLRTQLLIGDLQRWQEEKYA